MHVRRRATIDDDRDELLRFATLTGGRYMGPARAEEFGRRNAVPEEILVRVEPLRVISNADVAG